MTDLNRIDRKIAAEEERFTELRTELMDLISRQESARNLRQHLEGFLHHVSEAEVRMTALQAQKDILEYLAEENA